MDASLADYLLRKTEADYDRIADDFSVTRAFPWAEMKDLVSQYVSNGERILDAGCGNGRLFELIQNKSIFYEGIDASQNLVEIARRKYGDRFQVGNLIDLDNYPKNSFSLIFCIATLQHIPGAEYRERVLRNFNQLLLPDSLLLLINWNILGQEKFKPYLKKYSKKALFGKGQFDRGDILFPWRSRQDRIIYRYYHGFSEEEIGELLQKTDFSLEDQYFTRRGQKADPKTGYNLVTIARKK